MTHQRGQGSYENQLISFFFYKMLVRFLHFCASMFFVVAGEIIYGIEYNITVCLWWVFGDQWGLAFFNPPYFYGPRPTHFFTSGSPDGNPEKRLYTNEKSICKSDTLCTKDRMQITEAMFRGWKGKGNMGSCWIARDGVCVCVSMFLCLGEVRGGNKSTVLFM